MEILDTQTQKIISLNGAYYVLISKKARDHHGSPEKAIDHKLHNAVVETIKGEYGVYSRIHFEAKPAPVQAQAVNHEPRSAVEAIEQAQAAGQPQATAPGIPAKEESKKDG